MMTIELTFSRIGTVRYSHLARDFLPEVVEKLVPRPAAASSGGPSDTATNTGAIPSISPQSAHAVSLFHVRCCDES
jgi:hypothetical protein